MDAILNLSQKRPRLMTEVIPFGVFLLGQSILWCTILLQTGGNISCKITWLDDAKKTHYYTESLPLATEIFLVIGCFMLIQFLIFIFCYNKKLRLNGVLLPLYAMMNLGLILQLITGEYAHEAPSFLQSSLASFFLTCLVAVAFGAGLFVLSCLDLHEPEFIVFCTVLLLAEIANVVFGERYQGALVGMNIMGHVVQLNEWIKPCFILLAAGGHRILKTDRSCRIVFSATWVVEIILLFFANDSGDAMILLALGFVALSAYQLGDAILLLLNMVLLSACLVIGINLTGFRFPSWFPIEFEHIARRLQWTGNALSNQQTASAFRKLLLSVCRSGLFGTGLSNNEYLYSVYNTGAKDDLAFLVLLAVYGVGVLVLIWISYLVLLFNASCSYNRSISMRRFLTGKLVPLALCIQAVIHIGGNLNVLPLTGIPLPFISHGGMALTGSAILVGILLGNIMIPETKRLEIANCFKAVWELGIVMKISRFNQIIYARAENLLSRIRPFRFKRVLSMIMAAVLTLCFTLEMKVYSMDQHLSINTLSSIEAGVNADISEEELDVMDGFYTIAVFGLDNRSTGTTDSGRADSIMVAAINKETYDVEILSVFRDTFLQITEDGEYNRVNAASARGGVEGALKALNRNLDLTIGNYIAIDWSILVRAVDALGGVEIEIDEEERQQVNKYMVDVEKMSDIASEKLESSGRVKMDGVQATTFARIRKTSYGSDFRRAGRQQTVLRACVKKAREADAATLLSIINMVYNEVDTSLSMNDIISIAMHMNDYNFPESGIPFPEEFTTDCDKYKGMEVSLSHAASVTQLHSKLFGSSDYVPSETVQKISEDISAITGVDEHYRRNEEIKFFN